MNPPEPSTAGDFQALVGRLFRSGDLALTLVAVTPGTIQPGQQREPFVLVFSGPRERFLPQGIVHLSEESAGALDIFIVPVGMTDDSFQYEAVFG